MPPMADFFASPNESATPFVNGFNNPGREKAGAHGVSQHGGEDRVDQQEAPADGGENVHTTQKGAWSYFCTKLPEDRRDNEVGDEAATIGLRGQRGPAPPMVWALARLLTYPFSYLKPLSRNPHREPRYGKPSETPAANLISGIQEIASGTLPERGFISRGLYTAMVASGVMSE
ncbi:hypothetical protein QYE76_066046 [Lolium multiflorum]|uniref:Uncharacterized protein n=1 Tax=Lolium multiflorum TaxID=4521 RepID=A0AAD8W9C5_LOLMU|nr:hypothetical protein QYE76_066046 [Lolium multiflorum]